MAKKNNSLLDEIFKSTWKYSATLAVITLLVAFVMLPMGMNGAIAKALLPMLQTLAKWFAIFCAIVSIAKIISGTIDNLNKPKTIDFDKPFKPRSNPQASLRENQRNALFTHHDDQTKSELIEKKPTESIFQNEKNIKDQWTLEFINSLDWKVFENLCSQYFSAIGVKNKETELGADGGVDLFLFEKDGKTPIGVVQCKKWSNPVGVSLLRELLGVMHHQRVTKGYFFTTNKFNPAAIKFADDNNIDLVDGALLSILLKGLELDVQQRIYDSITQGDYTTPTCVRCGKKMVIRTNKKTQEEFWGCNTYRCMSTLTIKSSSQKNKGSRNTLLY